MGPYKRNWFVGGTVLLGLVTLGLLIILFGGSLGDAFAGEKIGVTFKSDRGDGLSEGSPIRYLGQSVGNVKRVDLVLDREPNHVLIHAELDKAVRLRRDLTAAIKITNFLGSAAIIELSLADAATRPAGPATFLTGGEEIATRYVGLDVLPPQFADLAEQLGGVAGDLKRADVVGTFTSTLATFREQATKFGKVADALDAVLGDPATQTDLKTAVARFREAVDRANAVAANFERISGDLKAMPAKLDAIAADVQAGVADGRQTIRMTQDRIATVSDNLNRNLEKVAAVLDEARAIANKVNAGNGTLALLLNDPKLYEKVVTVTEVINETVKDIQRLVRGFEEDGVPIDFK